MLSWIREFSFKRPRIYESTVQPHVEVEGCALDNELCRLPIEIARGALSAFLDVSDIVRLDSAALVHSHRELFQQRYKGITVVHNAFIELTASAAQWLSTRQIYIHYVKISRIMVDEWSRELRSIMRDVIRVHIGRASDLDSSKMTDLFNNCSKLKYLCVKDCALNTEMLQVVMSLCPLLTELDLAFTNLDSSSIGPLLSPRLIQLNLSYCDGIDDEAIIAITSACTNLNLLRLDRCDGCTNLSIDAIGRYCPRLLVLSLGSWTDLSDESVERLAAGCTELQCLQLRGSVALTSVGVCAIAAHCTRLLEFSMYNCDAVGTDALVALASSCTDLDRLNSQADDSVLRALSEHCPYLTELSLTNLAGQYDALLDGDAVGELIYNCQSLVDLSLPQFSALPLYEDCTGAVEVLCLYYGRNRTDEQLCSLVRILPNLRDLQLQLCSKLTDNTVYGLAEFCPRLQSLNLADLRLLTDESIIELSMCCLMLSKINLSGCVLLTDAAVISLAENCLDLTDVTINNTNNRPPTTTGTAMALLRGKYLGDASVAAFAAHSKHLQFLDIKGHPRISNAAVKALMAALPNCRVYQKGYSSFPLL